MIWKLGSSKGIIFISKAQNNLAATMKYGLGSKDPEELAFYNKIMEEMDDMKKDLSLIHI